MSIDRSFSIALVLFACCAAAAPAVIAQTRQDPRKLIYPDPAATPPKKLIYPDPAQTQPQKLIYPNPAQTQPVAPAPAKPQPDPLLMRPMIFYEAHGEVNACGPGCSEWIVAEGKIEADSADRLRHLLTRLDGGRPPIFFHSPGGSVNGSLELGRLIRALKMTVSVGNTIPLNCDRDPVSKNPCEPQIKAGHPIEAGLDHQNFLCNSGCVYALAAGTTRLIPPFVTLGIHDVGFMGSEKVRRASADAIEYAKSVADGRVRSYLHQMGIDDGLWTEAFAVPFSSMKPLSRDDAARFGLDRREFGDTVWYFTEKAEPAARKSFFLRTTLVQPHYINGFLNLACGKGASAGYYIFGYAREHLDSDVWVKPAAQSPINISLNDKQYRFIHVPNDKFWIRGVRLSPAELNAIGDTATIVLPGSEFGRQDDTTVTMVGFAAAFAKLQQSCAATNEPAARPAPSASSAPLPPNTDNGVAHLTKPQGN